HISKSLKFLILSAIFFSYEILDTRYELCVELETQIEIASELE
ncbi:unnamed protein product, partial [marine sediment metagenome]